MPTRMKLVLALLLTLLLVACVAGQPEEAAPEWPEDVIGLITTVDQQPLNTAAWETAGWEIDLSSTVTSPSDDCVIRPITGLDGRYAGSCASLLVHIPTDQQALISAIYSDYAGGTLRMVVHTP